MTPSNVKVFECNEYIVIFNGQDMTLRLLPLQQYRVSAYDIFDYIQCVEEQSCLLGNVQENLSDVFPCHTVTSQTRNSLPKHDQRPTLQRLTLNVSNTCNMACKYCYANGGTYYTSGKLMNKNTALNAINFVSRNFSRIEHVNFFGGEPTMNQSIIELICEYFIYLHSRGILSYLPHFGLTTNGYAISAHMFEILQRCDFSVSVSLDGPKEIHDRLRVSSNGSPTYDAIEKNIKKLIDMGIVPEFECTYTGEHWQRGIDLVALMDFFYDNFQCHTLHCPLVIANPNSPWFIPLGTATKLYADAIRYSIRNLAREVPNSISVATRFLNSLTAKTPIWQYCPAGKSSLTINADGNIYACFMLMRGTGYCLGNVNGEDHGFGRPDSIGVLLEDANKWQNPACCDCWAQSLCFGCLGEDLVREGQVVQRSVIPGQSGSCDFKRKLVEVFLMSVVEIYLDSVEKLGVNL